MWILTPSLPFPKTADVKLCKKALITLSSLSPNYGGATIILYHVIAKLYLLA